MQRKSTKPASFESPSPDVALDGTLKFQVILGPEEGALFMAEALADDRPLSSLARIIIKRYFRLMADKPRGFAEPPKVVSEQSGAADFRKASLATPPDENA